MDEHWFIAFNIILLGIAGVLVLIYLVFLTRKRLTSGYTHPKNKFRLCCKRQRGSH